MNISRRIFFIKLLHWIYVFGLTVTYWLSFWTDKTERLFFFLAGTLVVSWIPFKNCPLTLWENRLREKINLRKRRFFGFTELIFSVIKRFFGFKIIPAYSTLYLIGILVIIRILMWFWRRGRVVECTGLENRKVREGLGGSNPPVSASRFLEQRLINL